MFVKGGRTRRHVFFSGLGPKINVENTSPLSCDGLNFLMFLVIDPFRPVAFCFVLSEATPLGGSVYHVEGVKAIPWGSSQLARLLGLRPRYKHPFYRVHSPLNEFLLK